MLKTFQVSKQAFVLQNIKKIVFYNCFLKQDLRFLHKIRKIK